jgi:hypothetical protein
MIQHVSLFPNLLGIPARNKQMVPSKSDVASILFKANDINDIQRLQKPFLDAEKIHNFQVSKKLLKLLPFEFIRINIGYGDHQTLSIPTGIPNFWPNRHRQTKLIQDQLNYAISWLKYSCSPEFKKTLPLPVINAHDGKELLSGYNPPITNPEGTMFSKDILRIMKKYGLFAYKNKDKFLAVLFQDFIRSAKQAPIVKYPPIPHPSGFERRFYFEGNQLIAGYF